MARLAGVAGVVVGLVAIALLLLSGLRRRLLPAALGGAVLAVLLAPGAWAVSVPGSTSAMGGANPMAGPAGGIPFGSGSFPGGAPDPAAPDPAAPDPAAPDPAASSFPGASAAVRVAGEEVCRPGCRRECPASAVVAVVATAAREAWVA
ncbi:hypothetical protein SAZ11_57145 [Streptomyces sp. FXJ1.4098]|nr:hypothetical protein [Streptomyces sp. FXJ1.4098]